MSSTGYIRPDIHPLKRELSYATTQFLKQYCGGKFALPSQQEIRLDAVSVDYLQGVCDATPDGEVQQDCKAIIEAIQQYGAILFWFEG